MPSIMTLKNVGDGSILSDLFDNPPRYSSLGTVLVDICKSRREPLKLAASKTEDGWDIYQIVGDQNSANVLNKITPQRVAQARTLYPYNNEAGEPVFDGEALSSSDAIDLYVEDNDFEVGDLLVMYQNQGGFIGEMPGGASEPDELRSIASFTVEETYFHG